MGSWGQTAEGGESEGLWLGTLIWAGEEEGDGEETQRVDGTGKKMLWHSN